MRPVTDRLVSAPGRRRVVAAAWDYAVIVGWLAVVTGVGAVVRLLAPTASAALRSDNVLVADLLAFVISVLPVGLYLIATEAGLRQASWGKRRVGLRVVTAADGGRSGLGRIILRNAVKLLPWQLAHLPVTRWLVGTDPSPAVWAAYALSLLIPIVSIAMTCLDPRRRALHDRVAGTRVVLA